MLNFPLYHNTSFIEDGDFCLFTDVFLVLGTQQGVQVSEEGKKGRKEVFRPCRWKRQCLSILEQI
jgi:hypothetical protein